jgi:uncharacterized protein
MKFVEYQDVSRYRIRAYEANRIKLEQEWILLPCALCAQALMTDWQPANADQLCLSDFSPLLASRPADLIIVGRPHQPAWNPEWMRLQAELNAQGIGLEQMQTDAAIRTFNVLTTEERSVWLVLLG